MTEVAGHSRGPILGLRPGQVIDGRFQVGQLIGYGGQGVVLNIKHLEWDRHLALKLPLPEVVQSPKNRERYLQEAESWIRLGVHPNIVRCWFVHPVAGLPGLFLDLIKGGSLEDRIKEGDYLAENPWAEILNVLLQIAEGLTHSHSMGMVHRDIKPENILIREDQTICLTDFGLVKSFVNPDEEGAGPDAAAPVSRDSSVTGTGQFVGSPRYGAPEQWNKALTIGPATDVYAMGILLFEMMCGRRPFDAPGENPDPLTLIHRHLKDPAPDPRKYRGDIPAPLAEFCLHCIAKNSEHRPQNSAQMIQLMTRLLGEVCNESYEAPRSVPDGERSDLLNNAAVSLFSLGKTEQCRELLKRGLLLQAGHPECLYNLVQLDRREAKITGGESIRQLRRANLKYELALLCIEEGLGKQARALLEAIPEHEKNGLINRVQGDALMYARNYKDARMAYGDAQRVMPHDVPTRLRKDLAYEESNQKDGSIFFPSPSQVFKDTSTNPDLHFFLAPDSSILVGVGPKEVLTLTISEQPRPGRLPRPEGASKFRRARWAPNQLLIEDQSGFELWDLSRRECTKRIEGFLLAATRRLDRLVYLTRQGAFLIEKGKQTPLQFAPGHKLSPAIKACFTLDEAGLCLMTSDGRIGQVDGQYRVIPLPWPPPLPRFKEIRNFQLSMDGILYTTTAGGHFNAVNFAQKKMNFSLKLPFVPETLKIDRAGKVLIVSSSKEFGVLKTNGKVQLRGEGPFAVDPTLRYGLTWCQGYLMLYQLHPFRRLRTWTDKIERPIKLSFANDGRKALSVSAQGEHLVWEVDEDNRVYERNLLLTPGASYDDLINSFDVYLQLFNQALRLFEKKRYYHAYVTLTNARSESGYIQTNEALQLQWQLCKLQRRGGLEAIWERMFSTDICSTSLSADNQALVVAERHKWSVRNFGDGQGSLVLELASPSPIIGVRHQSLKDGKSLVAIFHFDGTVAYHQATDGRPIHKQKLELGKLRQANNLHDSVFLCSELSKAAFFDMKSNSLGPSFNLDELEAQKLFPLANSRLLALTKQGPKVVDFQKQSVREGLPCKIKEVPGQVTFALEHTSRGLLLLGFSDGTFAVAQAGGKALFTHKEDKGAITGACLRPEMGFGAVVTSKGGLCLFDLGTGYIFERFTAHNEPIVEVTVCSSGRYLRTRTFKGQFRLWELSWLLLEETGPPKVDWMPSGALGKLGRMFKF